MPAVNLSSAAAPATQGGGATDSSASATTRKAAKDVGATNVVARQEPASLFLRVAASAAYPFVEDWFRRAADGMVATSASTEATVVQPLETVDIPRAHQRILRARDGGVKEKALMLAKLSEMHATEARCEAVGQTWVTAFAAHGNAYLAELGELESVLQDRRAKAGEWTTTGVRESTQRRIARFEAKRAALATRTALEEAQELRHREQECARLRVAFESCVAEVRDVMGWYLQEPCMSVDNRGGSSAMNASFTNTAGEVVLAGEEEGVTNSHANSLRSGANRAVVTAADASVERRQRELLRIVLPSIAAAAATNSAEDAEGTERGGPSPPRKAAAKALLAMLKKKYPDVVSAMREALRAPSPPSLTAPQPQPPTSTTTGAVTHARSTVTAGVPGNGESRANTEARRRAVPLMKSAHPSATAASSARFTSSHPVDYSQEQLALIREEEALQRQILRHLAERRARQEVGPLRGTRAAEKRTASGAASATSGAFQATMDSTMMPTQCEGGDADDWSGRDRQDGAKEEEDGEAHQGDDGATTPPRAESARESGRATGPSVPPLSRARGSSRLQTSAGKATVLPPTFSDSPLSLDGARAPAQRAKRQAREKTADTPQAGRASPATASATEAAAAAASQAAEKDFVASRIAQSIDAVSAQFGVAGHDAPAAVDNGQSLPANAVCGAADDALRPATATSQRSAAREASRHTPQQQPQQRVIPSLHSLPPPATRAAGAPSLSATKNQSVPRVGGDVRVSAAAAQPIRLPVLRKRHAQTSSSSLAAAAAPPPPPAVAAITVTSTLDGRRRVDRASRNDTTAPSSAHPPAAALADSTADRFLPAYLRTPLNASVIAQPAHPSMFAGHAAFAAPPPPVPASASASMAALELSPHEEGAAFDAQGSGCGCETAKNALATHPGLRGGEAEGHPKDSAAAAARDALQRRLRDLRARATAVLSENVRLERERGFLTATAAHPPPPALPQPLGKKGKKARQTSEDGGRGISPASLTQAARITQQQQQQQQSSNALAIHVREQVGAQVSTNQAGGVSAGDAQGEAVDWFAAQVAHDQRAALAELRTALASRQEELARTQDAIADVQTRIRRHDALMRAAQGFWRANAAAMRRTKNAADAAAAMALAKEQPQPRQRRSASLSATTGSHLAGEPASDAAVVPLTPAGRKVVPASPPRAAPVRNSGMFTASLSGSSRASSHSSSRDGAGSTSQSRSHRARFASVMSPSTASRSQSANSLSLTREEEKGKSAVETCEATADDDARAAALLSPTVEKYTAMLSNMKAVPLSSPGAATHSGGEPTVTTTTTSATLGVNSSREWLAPSTPSQEASSAPPASLSLSNSNSGQRATQGTAHAKTQARTASGVSPTTPPRPPRERGSRSSSSRVVGNNAWRPFASPASEILTADRLPPSPVPSLMPVDERRERRREKSASSALSFPLGEGDADQLLNEDVEPLLLLGLEGVDEVAEFIYGVFASA